MAYFLDACARRALHAERLENRVWRGRLPAMRAQPWRHRPEATRFLQRDRHHAIRRCRSEHKYVGRLHADRLPFNLYVEQRHSCSSTVVSRTSGEYTYVYEAEN